MLCDSFDIDNAGFTATSNLDRERLMFFSVPYDKGWSASVNGKPAVIEKANVGFMAVRVPAGEATIRFNYMPPGLIEGIKTTLKAIGVLLIYIVIVLLLRRRRKKKALTKRMARPRRQPVRKGKKPKPILIKSLLSRPIWRPWRSCPNKKKTRIRIARTERSNHDNPNISSSPAITSMRCWKIPPSRLLSKINSLIDRGVISDDSRILFVDDGSKATPGK
jgi:hypothetical protein